MTLSNLLSAVNLPESTVRYEEPLTSAFVKSEGFGDGKLLVTEQSVAWIRSDGQGFLLDYPSIVLHAISRDTSQFPHECLYLMLDKNLVETGERDSQGSSDEDDEDVQATEVRFVPSCKEHLNDIYDAMCECQKLHPDPEDVDSEDNDYYDEESAGDGIRLSAQGMNNLQRYENMLAQGMNGDTPDNQHEAMEEDEEHGQFDDA